MLQKSDNNRVLIQDPGLDAFYSLTHVYTIGFRNDGSQETDNAEHRELFELLAALYSATMSKDEKLRVLNEKFGLQDLKSPEHDLIEVELSNMDALTAAIRDDYDEKLERFHRIIAEKDSLIHEKDSLIHEKDSLIHEKDSLIDSLIHEKDGLINEKNELLSVREKELSDARDEINMLRSKLAARDNS